MYHLQISNHSRCNGTRNIMADDILNVAVTYNYPDNSIGLLKILCILNKGDLAKFFKLAEIQEEF